MKTPANDTHPKQYMPTLDGLRGLACLLVVFSHLAEPAHLEMAKDTRFIIGSSGVVIFFALSGFLMSRLYLATQPFEIATASEYIAARFSRIVPVYLVAVLIYLLLTHVVPGFKPVDGVQALRLLLLCGSASVFWSIPPEIQFYGFFLVLWYAKSRSSRTARVVLCLLGAVAVISAATSDRWPGLVLLSKLHIFLLGTGAAVLAMRMGKRLLGSPWFQAAILAALPAYAAFVLRAERLYSDVAFAALAALAVASLSFLTPVTSFLATRPMRFLGAASFSIYLLHDPIIRITDLTITPLSQQSALFLCVIGGAALLVPSLFHVAVEKRLTRVTRKYLSRRLCEPMVELLQAMRIPRKTDELVS